MFTLQYKQQYREYKNYIKINSLVLVGSSDKNGFGTYPPFSVPSQVTLQCEHFHTISYKPFVPISLPSLGSAQCKYTISYRKLHDVQNMYQLNNFCELLEISLKLLNILQMQGQEVLESSGRYFFVESAQKLRRLKIGNDPILHLTENMYD